MLSTSVDRGPRTLLRSSGSDIVGAVNEDDKASSTLPVPLVTPLQAPADVPSTRPTGPGTVEVGYALAAIGALLFSTKAIAIKLAYADAADAETLLAWRMGVSFPIYAVIAGFTIRQRRRRKAPLPTRRVVVRAALVGALGYWFASYTDFLGLEYISASFERLILFTYPLFVVVLGATFFGQPVRPRALAAVGVSYIGLTFIFAGQSSSGDEQVLLGAALVLAAAVAFALYQLLAKPVIARMGPRLFTCVAMGAAGVAAFVHFLLTHPLRDLLVTPRVALLGVFLGIGATVIPSFFLNAALHRISPQANATIATLSPVATILLAFLILGERLTTAGVIGTAFVLTGVGWFAWAERG